MLYQFMYKFPYESVFPRCQSDAREPSRFSKTLSYVLKICAFYCV